MPRAGPARPPASDGSPARAPAHDDGQAGHCARPYGSAGEAPADLQVHAYGQEPA